MPIGLKKKLQDSVVKLIIFNIHDTKKWSFPLKIYLINVSKSAVLFCIFTFTK